MRPKPDKSSNGEPQSIEELQRRYQQLHTRKIQAETHLQNAKERLDCLKREARDKYQTDDLDALRDLLAKMTSENETKRREYQADLDRIEADLIAVEQKFASQETPETAEGTHDA